MGTRFKPGQSDYIAKLNDMDDDVQAAITKGDSAAAAAVAAAQSEAAATAAAGAAQGAATAVIGKLSDANALNNTAIARAAEAAASAATVAGSVAAAAGSAAAAGGSATAANTAKGAAEQAAADALARKNAADAAANLAQDWAVKLGATVNGVDYSAKHWAQQAQAAAGQVVAGQIQSDWSQADPAQKDYIKNKPNLATLNAATATKLATARAVNGVNFDGTAPITIYDATKLPLDGSGYMAGKLWAKVPDAGRILQSNNTTAQGEPVQFRIDHNTAGVVIANDRGTLQLDAGGGGVVAVPDRVAGDNSSASANTRFVMAAVAQGKADLVGSAPTTLDTLIELATALGNDPNFATTTATALGYRVRFDINNQGLSGAQQANARTNIGLSNVDNTSDANKPVSATQQIALNAKADKANATLTKPTIKGYIEQFQALNPGAVVTVNPDLGTLIEITTTVSATTINLPDAVAGMSYTTMVKYGATGHTTSFSGGTALRPAGGAVPTSTSVAGKIDVYSMLCGTGYTIIRDGGRNA